MKGDHIASTSGVSHEWWGDWFCRGVLRYEGGRGDEMVKSSSVSDSGVRGNWLKGVG